MYNEYKMDARDEKRRNWDLTVCRQITFASFFCAENLFFQKYIPNKTNGKIGQISCAEYIFRYIA